MLPYANFRVVPSGFDTSPMRKQITDATPDDHNAGYNDTEAIGFANALEAMLLALAARGVDLSVIDESITEAMDGFGNSF